ncbi:hypothetical protein Pyrfu_0236 [Pyrolobus fumarii 1A]|uniref:Uncharacterized protein n=1 Tax=Pyrolobus fumarii (strain DSM 11204 / 1A) TaxID=694429 RepID=G0EEZ4_PYRF1|nr:hypothetical protein [Pyrolobus fumarii]AEM38108.1 hypothetical protein Pyrfu_0236 [Pyrolobus fumarii 1A]
MRRHLATLALTALVIITFAHMLLNTSSPSTSDIVDNIDVFLVPGSRLHGYQNLFIVVKGVEPWRVEAHARVVFELDVWPWYLPLYTTRVETSVFALRAVSLPYQPDTSIVVVPPVPATLVEFNSSFYNVVNAILNITAVLEVNVSIDGEQVASFRVAYLPEPSPGRPIPLLNVTRVALATTPTETIHVCGIALGGVDPRPEIVVSSDGGSSWHVATAHRIALFASQEEAAKLLNDTISYIVEHVLINQLQASSFEEINATGPGAAAVCADITPSALGLDAGDELVYAVSVDGLYSPPSIAYVYNPNADIDALIVDPGVSLVLHALNPSLAAFNTTMWRLGFNATVYSLARLYAEYARLYHYLLDNWTSVPLSHWGAVGRVARLEIATSVEEALHALDSGTPRVVILGGWLGPVDGWATLASRLAELVLEGKTSVILSGLSFNPLVYVECGSIIEYRRLGPWDGGILPGLAGLHLTNILARASPSLIEELCSTGYSLEAIVAGSGLLPPMGFTTGTLIATQYADILGYTPGTSLTVKTPVPRIALSRGYRALTSLSWVTLKPIDEVQELLAAATSPEYIDTVYRFVKGLYTSLPLSINASLVAEAYRAMLAGLPYTLLAMSQAEYLWQTLSMPSIRVQNSTVSIGGLLPPWERRLSLENPSPRILFESGDGTAAILDYALCRLGVHVIYSSVPLEWATSGSELLASIVTLAASKPHCSTINGIAVGPKVAREVDNVIGDRVVGFEEVVLLASRGSAELRVCNRGLVEPRLVIAVLDGDINLVVRVNGSIVEPLESNDAIRVYGFENGCSIVTLESLSAALVQPVRVLVMVVGEPLTVTVTKSTTVTTTETVTVMRNVTIPAGTVTKTVYVNRTVTRLLTTTRTVTSERVVTYTLERNLTVTLTTTSTVTLTATTSVFRTVTLPGSVTTVTLLNTSVVTVVKERVRTSTVTVRAETINPLAALGAGLAGGAAIGYLAPRLASRLARRE